MVGNDGLSALRAASGVIRLHGHRGARGVMPENTMAGFQFALACGVKVLEFDVLLCRDLVPVITHNPRLMPDLTRDASGQWLAHGGPTIRNLSVDDLQTYDVGGLQQGSIYGGLYPDQAFLDGERIPALAQLLALVTQPEHTDVWLDMEIKSNPNQPEDTPPIPALVSATLEVLQSFGVQNRCIIQSFDWRVLREVAAQAPYMARSYLSDLPNETTPAVENIYDGSPWMDGHSLADYEGSLPRLVADLGGAIWSPYFADITEADMLEARARGLIVNVWTVNLAADIDRMIALEVDGIISDYPGRVQRRLLAQGLHWRSGA